MRERIPLKRASAGSASLAAEATRGRILSFGQSMADCGNPVDWHRNPVNGNRWPVDRHWAKTLRTESLVGDVKFTWEAARFPQAYLLARGAAFAPDAAGDFSDVLFEQMQELHRTKPGKPRRTLELQSRDCVSAGGVAVWNRSVRTNSRVAGRRGRSASSTRAALAPHIEQNIEYARSFVYNNHLLSEALGLYLSGTVLPQSDLRESWTRHGRSLLDQEADRQVYPDGGYIQQSHNYHRVAMQVYLVAGAVAKARGEEPPAAWRRAMERSLDFLIAHQNPVDGRLPNYGSNDGALPCILSCCDFSDFRPTLQALSLASRGERVYEPGPWDEEACWFLGSRRSMHRFGRQSENLSRSNTRATTC